MRRRQEVEPRGGEANDSALERAVVDEFVGPLRGWEGGPNVSKCKSGRCPVLFLFLQDYFIPWHCEMMELFGHGDLEFSDN